MTYFLNVLIIGLCVIGSTIGLPTYYNAPWVPGNCNCQPDEKCVSGTGPIYSDFIFPNYEDRNTICVHMCQDVNCPNGEICFVGGNMESAATRFTYFSPPPRPQNSVIDIKQISAMDINKIIESNNYFN